MNWNPWYSVREKSWKFNQPDFYRKALMAGETVEPQLCLLNKGIAAFLCQNSTDLKERTENHDCKIYERDVNRRAGEGNAAGARVQAA